jgi:hypothetical protein
VPNSFSLAMDVLVRMVVMSRRTMQSTPGTMNQLVSISGL